MLRGLWIAVIALASFSAAPDIAAASLKQEAVIEAGSFSNGLPAGFPEGWELVPAKTSGKRTLYRLVREGEIVVLKAVSQAASSGLMRVVSLNPRDYPIIQWRWKVEDLLRRSDLFRKSGDDFSARVFLSFETDPSKAGWRERIYVQAGRLLYGDYPLAEGLNYVWASREPKGTMASSPYTERLKTVVIESGSDKLNTWVVEERNFYEDYKKAFGQEPPTLYGVAVMTDTDNTGGEAVAYYGDILFSREPLKSAIEGQPRYGTITESPSLPVIRGTAIISKNIDRQGRRIRALGGIALLAAALLVSLIVPSWPVWKIITVISFLCGGSFMLFEAFSGWCVLRACGIKTPL